ncbi:MAG: T9SS type A sorting domain-containing protein, partial [Crocinitomicaceae bacterium]|nr:T9SS type A sorting domain-containing protein [Crocinitomicaceae bacterium]
LINTASTLEIHEGIDMIGSITATDGEISFIGIVESFFDPGGGSVTLNDVSVSCSDPAGMTFYEGEFVVNGTFAPNGGLITIEATTDFIINSSGTSNSGRVGIIDPGCTILGNVKTRRFIPAGSANWRDICSPLVGSDISMWDDSIAISGTGMPDGCAFDASGCFHSAVYYINDIKFEIANPTEPLTNTRGFEVFLGDDLTTFSGVTLEVSGSLNSVGDIVVSCPGNFSTIGNPYASQIDFTAASRSGVGNYYYVFDEGSSSYQYYDGASGSGSITSLNTGIIPMGQAFWCKGPGTITFNQACKTDASATFTRASSVSEDRLIIALTSASKPNHYGSVMFEENFDVSDGVDELLDIPSLISDNALSSTIGVIIDESILRKNYIEKNFRDKTFELHTDIKYADTYTISLENFDDYRSYRSVILVDKLTGEKVDLKVENEYSFFSEEFEGNRFTLVLSNSINSSNETISGFGTTTEFNMYEEAGNLYISADEDFGTSQIMIFSLSGQQVGITEVINVNAGVIEYVLPDNLKGLYIVTINNGFETISKKVVL